MFSSFAPPFLVLVSGLFHSLLSDWTFASSVARRLIFALRRDPFRTGAMGHFLLIKQSNNPSIGQSANHAVNHVLNQSVPIAIAKIHIPLYIVCGLKDWRISLVIHGYRSAILQCSEL